MIGLWVSLVVGFSLGHLVGLCLEANPIGRMSSGSPPPFFFLRETRKLKSEKREEKETDGELTTSPYPSLSFSNASFQLPAFSTVVMSRHKILPILATSRRDKYRGRYHDVARIIIRRWRA